LSRKYWYSSTLSASSIVRDGMAAIFGPIRSKP
jgi:hypothetical protein